MKGFKYKFNGHGYQLVRIVSRLLGMGFEPVFFEERVDFVNEDDSIFISLMDESGILHVVFFSAIPKFEGVTLEMVDEGSGLGHQWHYRGEKIEELILLIEIALANYKKNTTV